MRGPPGAHPADGARRALLRRFGLDDGALLGEGGESWVYALDGARVLRVSKGGDRRADLERLRRFYRSLPPRPFALPDIHEIDVERGGGDMGVSYSVEARIAGAPLSERLPSLGRRERERALAHYLDATESLGEIELPDARYGQLLAAAPRTAPSWQAFLTDTVERAARDNGIDADLPRLDAEVARTLAEVGALPDPPRALVHGDLFPGNVLVADDLTVTGVLDFSPHTVVGDPRMDLAGALAFLEVTPGYREDDSATLHALLLRRHGVELDPILRLYRRFHAFYFSFARDDVPLYRWCVAVLRGELEHRLPTPT